MAFVEQVYSSKGFGRVACYYLEFVEVFLGSGHSWFRDSRFLFWLLGHQSPVIALGFLIACVAFPGRFLGGGLGGNLHCSFHVQLPRDSVLG